MVITDRNLLQWIHLPHTLNVMNNFFVSSWHKRLSGVVQMNCSVNLQTSDPQNGGQVESWRSGTHLCRWTLCMSGRKSGHSWRTQPSMACAPVLLLLLPLCLFSTTLHLQPDMSLLTEPASHNEPSNKMAYIDRCDPKNKSSFGCP